MPKVTDSGARKMTTFSSLKHAFNKQLRDFKIECRHAWQNKDVKKLWEYTVHCVGFFGYTVISVALALFMWIAAFFLTIGKSKKQNDDQSTYMALLNFVFKIFEVIFMTFFQIFAGMMGWGAYNTKPSQVPWRILGSISQKVKPSVTTQFFGYGTIGFIGFTAVQFFQSLI